MNLPQQKKRVKNFLYYKSKSNVFRFSNSEKRILYFGIPMHTNMGDQAQKYCIRNWLKEYYSDHEVLEIPTRIIVDKHFGFIKKLKGNVRKSDIFIFQSGYCTHDIEPSQEDLMHRIVIENFPNNRILMMPQTVFFQNINRKILSSKVYSKASRMLFLTRDKVSFNIAKEMFPGKQVELYPDIVTSMIGSKHFSRERKGILICARRDCEKYYSEEEISNMVRKLQKISSVDMTDTTIDNIDSYWLDNHFKEYFDEVLEKYASYEVIITDRYHGTIFSLIAETPAIVIKTTDHKVSTGVEWFKGVYDTVEFAESLDDAITKAVRCINTKKANAIHTFPYFNDKYYAKLKLRFDEVIK